MKTPFIENDCTIRHEGKSFTSGGAWICECSDGYYHGIVYVKPDDSDTSPLANGVRLYSSHLRPCAGSVTTWHGERIAAAQFGARYQSTYCRMRSVSFEFNGMHFTGRYCPDTSQAVRVRARKPVAVVPIA